MGKPIDEIAKAADGLAECLGNVVAAHERGETLPRDKIEHARRVILLWHQIKYKELSRASTARR